MIKAGQVWVRKSTGVRWKVVKVKEDGVYYVLPDLDPAWDLRPRHRPVGSFLLNFRPLSALEQFLEGETCDE